MIISGEKKSDIVELEDTVLDNVSGGLIIPGNGPESVPDLVVDDRTLEVLGRTGSMEEAVKLAQGLGVSTERISQGEFENLKIRMKAGE